MGPIKKRKASFGLDAQRRSTQEDAFILATTLDANFAPLSVNQSVSTPQSSMGISPRLDYAINANNTLVARYQYNRMSFDKQGIGSFSLASKAYDQLNTENTLQVTETAIVSPRFINESRFQFMRTNSATLGDNTIPAINVAGAFNGGGAQTGNSGTLSDRLEVSNSSTYTRKTPTIKWGGRARQDYTDSTSVSNFGGTYSFLGGSGPVLDANNQPIAGESTDLTALEVYRRTLIFQKAGMTDAQIRLLGGGASQFSLSAGTPTTSVRQFDAGLYVNDDWRARSNLTFSYGLRYETQNNISDHGDLSPRISLAWGLDAKGSTAAKTVLRAGFGTFFDRVSENTKIGEQHQRPWGSIATHLVGVGARRQGQHGGQDGAARRLWDLLRPGERKHHAERGAVQRRDAAIVLHPQPLVLPCDPIAGHAGGGQAAAEPAIRGQRDESGAHVSEQHRAGPAGDEEREAQRDVSERARDEPVALARHQRADRRTVPLRRFAVAIFDGVHRVQPHQSDSGVAEHQLQKAVPVRVLRALLREVGRGGAAGGPLQFAGGVGAVEFRRRAASHGGGHEPAAAVEDLGEPVHYGFQRSAVQHHDGARHQRRQHYGGASVDCGVGGGAVHGKQLLLLGELRLLQLESGAGDEHHPELRARTWDVQPVDAGGANVDDRRPW